MAAKMKACKVCGEQIAKNAKVCPHCGAKNKKIIFKRWWFWALIIVIVLGAILFGGDSGPKKPSDPNKTPEQVKTEYIASCSPIDYDAVAREPDKAKGMHVSFTGAVIQVMESGYHVTLRVALDEDYDQVVYVDYTREEGESRILEDDVITGYGDCKGVTSYTSVLGGTITIPSVAMFYYEPANAD